MSKSCKSCKSSSGSCNPCTRHCGDYSAEAVVRSLGGYEHERCNGFEFLAYDTKRRCLLKRK